MSTKESQADARAEFPTLAQLEGFIAVAKFGSYSRAAEATRQEVSGLWRSVARLEAKLHVKLLERGRGADSTRATPAGQALLPAATRVVDGARQLLLEADEVRRGRRIVIRVGCYPAHVRDFVAAAIAAIHETWPGVEIRLPHVADDDRVAAGDPLFKALLGGDVELIIAPDRAVASDAFFKRDLYAWSLVALVPEEGAANDRREPWSVDRLKNATLVASPRGFSSREMLESAAKSAGFAPSVRVETPSTEALIALVEHGYGVGVIPSDAVPPGTELKQHSLLGSERDTLGGRYAIFARPDLADSPVVRDLVDRLVKARPPRAWDGSLLWRGQIS